MFVIIPYIDEIVAWPDQRIQTTLFNAERGVEQGDTVPTLRTSTR